MALSTKKSRPLSHDGRDYRWLVKHGFTRFEGRSHKKVDLVIQEAGEHAGRPLRATLLSKNWVPENETEPDWMHKATIKPFIQTC